MHAIYVMHIRHDNFGSLPVNSRELVLAVQKDLFIFNLFNVDN